MSTRMYINGKAVGNGNWKLKSVKNYATKKKIDLKEAYSITASADYAYTSKLDLTTGIYNEGDATDHYGRAGF